MTATVETVKGDPTMIFIDLEGDGHRVSGTFFRHNFRKIVKDFIDVELLHLKKRDAKDYEI